MNVVLHVANSLLVCFLLTLLCRGSSFEAAVTMGCGDACPHVPARRHIDWDIPDPKHMDAESFAVVRDQIGALVRALLEES